jgi:hypothetical protein
MVSYAQRCAGTMRLLASLNPPYPKVLLDPTQIQQVSVISTFSQKRSAAALRLLTDQA